ncbi:hypothetical protein ACIPL1_27480 [Pseudomonas sp. NPDC090202]|uniref:hypothetical protein n=1 Tax=Pseudomonas sp. NPDC090202 TaxID=3364476 RepID=UPI00381D8233
MADSVNIYRYQFVAVCPSDGEFITYSLEIRTPEMIMVEHIKTATALIKTGYHEAIADLLFDRFGGEQHICATHQGVAIESVRGAA